MADVPEDGGRDRRNWLYQLTHHCLDRALQIADRAEDGQVTVQRAKVFKDWLIAEWEASLKENPK